MCPSRVGQAGASQSAIREYREAIRVRPDFVRASLDLGIALAESGDLKGGSEALRRAANAKEPGVKEKALQILEQINRQK
jgi:Flp pilus assembly protein TadD